jgi:hypothetical protein
MKKILLTSLCMTSFVMNAIAQQLNPTIVPAGIKEDTKINTAPNRERFSNAKNKQTRATTAYYRWVDYMAAESLIAVADIDLNSSLFYLFPDSTVRFNPPNQAFGLQYKSIGQVLDPASPIIKNNLLPGDMLIDSTTAYMVDSIYIAGSYVKMNAAVDTLIVSFVQSELANLPEFYFTGATAANFGVGIDTARFLMQLYSKAGFNNSPFQNNVVGAPTSYILKYPLTNADSSAYVAGSNSYNVKYIGINASSFAVPKGEKVSVSVTFKPGGTYAAGDTIGKLNRFLFMSCEPNGGTSGSFMPYWKEDRNMSSIIYKDSTNWGGRYIPTLAWSVGYGPEVHDIIWKLSCPTCFGLGTKDVWNAIKTNVYPNPAQNELYFDLELAQASKNILINIFDMQGRIVKSQSLSNTNALLGFKMDISTLNNGLYTYTINVDGNKYSNKITISK